MAILTNSGRAYLASKQAASEPIKLTRFVFCNIPNVTSSTPLSEGQTLPVTSQQVHSQPVDKQGYINPDSVVYSALLDTLTGDFTFNWVGLVADDDTLVMYGVSDPLQKNATKAGTPGNVLSRSFVLQLQNVAASANITIAAESWQIDSMAQFISVENRLRKSIADIAGKSLFFNDAMKLIKNGSGYQINPGSALLAGYTVALSQPITLDNLVNNPFVYLDVSIKNNINGSTIEVDSFISASAQAPDYTRDGETHFLIKVGQVNAGQAVDLREGATSANSLNQYLENRWQADIDKKATELTQQETGNRNSLKNTIDSEQASARNSLKNTIDNEQTQARTALKNTIDNEQAQARTALKNTISNEQAQARTALKNTISNEQAQARTALKNTISNEQAQANFGLKSDLESTIATGLNTQKNTIDNEQAQARTSLKNTIDNEQAQARTSLKNTIDNEQAQARTSLKNTIDSEQTQARNAFETEVENKVASDLQGLESSLMSLINQKSKTTITKITAQPYYEGGLSSTGREVLFTQPLDSFDLILFESRANGAFLPKTLMYSWGIPANLLTEKATLLHNEGFSDFTDHGSSGRSFLTLQNIQKSKATLKEYADDGTDFHGRLMGVYGVKF